LQLSANMKKNNKALRNSVWI